MNILCLEKRPFSQNVLSGQKPFIFIESNGHTILKDSMVYIYESKANNGLGGVIGEATIKTVVTLPEGRTIGPYRFFVRRFAEYTGNQEVLDALNKVGDFNITNYYKETIMSFLLCGDILDEILKKDEYPDIKKCILNSSYNDGKAKMHRFLLDCDDWLRSMGFYNYDERSYFNKCLELKNVSKYFVPKSLSDFISESGLPVKRMSKPWRYVKN